MRALNKTVLALYATMAAFVPGVPPRAQQEEASGLFPPPSQDFQVLWQELRERSAESDWKSVSE